jgi:hypothetical protein
MLVLKYDIFSKKRLNVFEGPEMRKSCLYSSTCKAVFKSSRLIWGSTSLRQSTHFYKWRSRRSHAIPMVSQNAFKKYRRACKSTRIETQKQKHLTRNISSLATLREFGLLSLHYSNQTPIYSLLIHLTQTS